MRQQTDLKSIVNARELGGIRIGDKAVKSRVLIRTASLTGITGEDKQVLENGYRVATVVDLRMSSERAGASDPDITGAGNIFIPVIELEDFPNYDPAVAQKISMSNTDMITLMKTAYELGMLDDKLYVRFLFNDRGQRAFRSFFAALLNTPEDRAFLWHCANGKDRTGVASMLILYALGADRQTVFDDYMLTNEYNADRIRAVSAGLEGSGLPEGLKQSMLFGAGAVYEQYLVNALDAIDEQCGSPSGYLEQILGIGNYEREEIRRRYLE